MDGTSLILFLVIGAVAGWLAGILMSGGGFGLIGNIVVGVVGAFLGGFIFNWLGLAEGGGLIGSLVVAVVGAVVLLAIIRVFKRA